MRHRGNTHFTSLPFAFVNMAMELGENQSRRYNVLMNASSVFLCTIYAAKKKQIDLSSISAG